MTNPISNVGIHVRGAALATALILLLVLTIVGVSVMNTVLLEERMAGNLRDQFRAFTTAETTLVAAENQLASNWKLGVPATPDCSNLICDSSNGSPFVSTNLGTFEDNAHNDAFWSATGTGAIAQAYGGTINGQAKPATYIIEWNGFVCSTAETGCQGGSALFYYTVTARGVGADPNSVAIVQSSFARKEDMHTLY